MSAPFHPWIRVPSWALVLTLSGFSHPTPSLAATQGDAQIFSLSTEDDLGVPANAVAIGDFNADGLGDLAVVTNSSLITRLTSISATGAISFTTSDFHPIAGVAMNIEVADLNDDGILDLVIPITNADGSLLLYRGLGSNGVGNGQFQYYSAVSFGSFWSVRIADVTGDGVLDLVTGANSGGYYVYRGLTTAGRPNGQFAFHRNLATPSGARGFQLYDINGDGALDIVGATPYEAAISIHLGIKAAGVPNGDFGPVISAPLPRSAMDVAVADFNRDGRPDLAVAMIDLPSGGVLLGNGGTSFALVGGIFPGWGSWFVKVADFDGDHRQDLVLTSVNFTMDPLLNDGRGAFPLGFSGSPGLGGNSNFNLVFGDLNADGGIDLVVARSQTGLVRTYLNVFDIPTLPLTTSVIGSGTITRSPAHAAFRPGESVTLTAVPGAQQRFLGWSGGLQSQQNPLVIGMTQALSLTAEFGPDNVTGVGHGPLAVALAPVAPNPGRGSARVRFTLPSVMPVRLEVLDAGGRCVRTLCDSEQEPGTHEQVWDGRDPAGQPASPGLYWLRLQTPGRTLTQRFTFLR